MDAGQHDGTEPGTAAMLYAGAIIGVLLRGATWVLSAFTLGPVLGIVDTVAGEYLARREALFVQAMVTVAAVVAAILGGLALQSEPARFRWPVRLLCGLFILDAVLYLTPIVFAAGIGSIEFTTAAWAVFAVAVVGNLGLAGLSLLIIIRSRAPARGKGGGWAAHYRARLPVTGRGGPAGLTDSPLTTGTTSIHQIPYAKPSTTATGRPRASIRQPARKIGGGRASTLPRAARSRPDRAASR
jgi:hypothetical protein